MMRSTKFLFFTLLVLVVAWAIIEAKSVSPDGDEVESSHDRSRRDAQGIFDKISGFMSAGQDGKSPAGNMVNGFMSRIKSGLGQAASALGIGGGGRGGR